MKTEKQADLPERDTAESHFSTYARPLADAAIENADALAANSTAQSSCRGSAALFASKRSRMSVLRRCCTRRRFAVSIAAYWSICSPVKRTVHAHRESSVVSGWLSTTQEICR